MLSYCKSFLTQNFKKNFISTIKSDSQKMGPTASICFFSPYKFDHKLKPLVLQFLYLKNIHLLSANLKNNPPVKYAKI